MSWKALTVVESSKEGMYAASRSVQVAQDVRSSMETKLRDS